jgi:hypothetical protein
VLGELVVATARYRPILMDDECGGSGGPLIECQDGRHQYSRS